MSNRGLLTLNAALLLALGAVVWGQAARAQNANVPDGARARGNYTMISGRTLAGGSDAVYVLDGTNQELVALRWDAAKQGLAGIGYRNLSADSKAAPAR
jgi:hypothetical protein